MKLSVIGAFFVLSVFFSCSSSNSEQIALRSSIDSLEKQMFKPESMELNKDLAVRGVALYQDYVAKYPQDSLAPEFLFRSSDLSRALGDNLKAIECLKQVTGQYPAYKKIPEALFLQGYYYQEFFNDTTQAKAFYDQLISKYPNHAFADDAKALMQMFGKSEQDIINDFEKKMGEKKSI